jgi:hypothetical protein
MLREQRSELMSRLSSLLRQVGPSAKVGAAMGDILNAIVSVGEGGEFQLPCSTACDAARSAECAAPALRELVRLGLVTSQSTAAGAPLTRDSAEALRLAVVSI